MRTDASYLPARVRFPVMHQRWDRIAFLHWQYSRSEIAGFLPQELEPDLWDGRAWVSVTPFLLDDLRPPLLPALPWISRFPETNLRTYVTNRAGEPGIWFFSLDAARLAAVGGARLTFGLPYMWSRMTVEQKGRVMEYRGVRRWPGPPGAGYDIAVETDRAIQPSELTGFDHFLTARFRLYSRWAGRMIHAQVEHPPWRFLSVRVVRISQTLTSAAGLSPPSCEPVVHFSPGVDTRIGKPSHEDG